MTEMNEPIAFIDLAAQQRAIRGRLDAAIGRVLDHGKYIMGPEVAELERQLADYTAVKHVVSCSNGTDALALPLMAWEIGTGDAVLCPSFTFAATAEIVPWVGASPVFVDVDERTYNIDPDHLQRTIEHLRDNSDLTPRAIIAVDLFGQPADYERIEAIAAKHDLLLLEDAAQGFGGRLNNRAAGSFGDAATTSFFPAKPIGGYGDGGAIFTDDDDLAERLRSLRVHGKGSDKYDNIRIGRNARLDTLQAAILLEKLAIFDDELQARQAVAGRYAAGLNGKVAVPDVMAGALSSWAQYTIRVADRDRFAAALRNEGVPTAVYYGKPLHLQTAYRDYPLGPGGLPVTERIAGEVISLPMHPYLDEATQARIIDAVLAAL